jgi:anaerobic ribonucleoside-triphosphate reductase activating protein
MRKHCRNGVLTKVDEITLNLADRLENFPVSRLNGPGLRYAFWVQGCQLRCTTDCLNPEYLDSAPKVILPVTAVADYICQIKVKYQIEGVTFLGGEPFDQAAALATLGQTLQAAGLSIVTYTGYTLEKLQRANRSDWNDLLAVTDLLIDGPFLPHLRSDKLRWRGSSNQQLRYLSNRYQAEVVETEPLAKGFNLLIRPDGSVKLSGLQNKEKTESYIAALQQQEEKE